MALIVNNSRMRCVSCWSLDADATNNKITMSRGQVQEKNRHNTLKLIQAAQLITNGQDRIWINTRQN